MRGGDSTPLPLAKNITLLKWFNFLIAFRPFAALAIIYFSQVTHSYALGLSLFSITQLAQAVCEIPTGIYSDRVGRKVCLIIGAFASLLSIVFYAIGQSYLILAIGAILQGAYFAAFNGNNAALLYETLAEMGRIEEYNETLGKMEAMLTLAFAIGGILGGILVFWSFTLLLWLSVLPALAGLVLSFLFIEPPVHRENTLNVYQHLKEAYTYFMTNAQLRQLSIADVLTNGIGEAAFQFQAVFFNTLIPLWAISFLNTANNLVATFSYHFSGRVTKKLKLLTILLSQEIYNRVVIILALLFPSILSPFLVMSGAVFYGVGNVAKNTLLQEQLIAKQRATMPSINALLGNCLFALVAFLMGLLADRIGVARTLLLAQLGLIPVFWLYVKVLRGRRKPIETGN